MADRPRRLLHLYMHIGRLLENRVSEELKAAGVHHAQGRVLSALAREGDLTQAQLARGMAVKPATVTVILKPMEKHGWIRRFTDPISGRARIVSLTKEGARLAESVRDAWDHVEVKIREALSASAYERAFRQLERVRDGLGGREPSFPTHPEV